MNSDPSTTPAPGNDVNWQDYLDELRMMDDGCPNCDPPPELPHDVTSTAKMVPAKPTGLRIRLRRRWLRSLLMGTVDVLIKIIVALVTT